jgi:DegV family protein with EDD domain
MKIVVDSGMDMAKDLIQKYQITVVPLTLMLEGKTYVGDKDITNEEFYAALSKTDAYPSTATPTPGMFAEIYRKIAQDDPDILSIHISSGLSSTIEAAKSGGEMVPEANITYIDTKGLSVSFGWQVEIAAKAIEKGYSFEQIKELINKVAENSNVMFTLSDLRYLIHGGRISHLKGLLASVLKIKPIITVTKDDGVYETVTQQRTITKALAAIVEKLHEKYGNQKLRIQLVHTGNESDLQYVKKLIEEKLNPIFLEPLAVATALGAHTGPSLIGVGFGLQSIFDEI